MATQVDKEILAGFYQEAKGYLPKIRSNLERLAEDPGQSELMQEAHRLVHSIKGAASMVGRSALSHLAYYVEETLEEITGGRLTLAGKPAPFWTRQSIILKPTLKARWQGLCARSPSLAR